MPKSIILGDPHIGKGMSIGKTGIGSNINSRVSDQFNLLDWVLERAIEHVAENIIITGDVFEDQRPHPVLIAMFISWLKKCQIHNVSVHIILGNHDMMRSGNIFTSSLDIISEIDLDSVSVYKHIDTMMIGNTSFTMMPFRDRKSFGMASNKEALDTLKETLVYELASIPLSNIKMLIGHLAIEGSIPVGDEIDDISNELFCPVDMFSGYDYVWMGHVHKPQIMNKKTPYVSHIGSMDLSNFGETDQKKFIIVIDCDNGNFDTEYLPTRSLKKLTINIPKDTADTTSYVIEQIEKEKNALSQAIVRVEISLSTSELKSVNKPLIEKYLSDNGAFNVTSISESKKVALIKKDENNTIDTKMDPVSATKKYAQTYVDVSMRNSFIELSMEIINTLKAEGKE